MKVATVASHQDYDDPLDDYHSNRQQALRIPLALQAVFRSSNRGNDVTDATMGIIASKVFARSSWSFKGRRSRLSFPRISSLLGNQRRNSMKNYDGFSFTTKMTEPSESCEDVTDKIEEKIAISAVTSCDETINQIQPPNSIRSDVSPQDYLNALLRSHGYSIDTKATLETGYYAQPTIFQKASYHPFVLNLARDGKMKIFKAVMESGISPNPCNAHGESIVHLVCRRCEVEALHILFQAGANPQVSDDSGRTPLHEACLRPQPSFEMIEMIADKDLNLFFLRDSRGALPLSYVHSHHWGDWINFLESKKDVWWPKLNYMDETSIGANVSFSEELLSVPPNSRPFPDPESAFSIDVAAMVSAGKLSPKETALFSTSSDQEREKEQIRIAVENLKGDQADKESCE